jgi:secreted trypsin-like serine protease
VLLLVGIIFNIAFGIVNYYIVFFYFFHTKVLNGQIAVNGQFPWAGLLSASGKYCTATLIRSDRILTAASCVSASQTGIVWFGSAPRGRSEEIRRNIVSVVLHPNYITSGRQNEYNIAVARINQEYDIYNSFIWPIQLPTDDLDYFEDDVGMLQGFGANDPNSGVSDYLRWNPFFILSRTQCSAIFPGTQNTNILCGESPASATCTFDEGAPLVLKVDGFWKVIGVNTAPADNASGRACVANTYSAFVRVSRYLDFIKTV